LSAQWAADQLPFPWSRRQIASAHRPAFDRSRRHVRVGTEWKQLVVAHSRCQNQKPSCTFAAVAGDGPRDYRRRTEDRWPRSGVHYQRQVWTEQLGRCQTRSRYRDGWHRPQGTWPSRRTSALDVARSAPVVYIRITERRCCTSDNRAGIEPFIGHIRPGSPELISAIR